MDRDYMLLAVRRRLKELEAEYKAACDNKTVDGRSLSPNGAGTKRSRIKRDVQVLMLLEFLLVTSSSVSIDDEDMLEGFDRLVKD